MLWVLKRTVPRTHKANIKIDVHVYKNILTNLRENIVLSLTLYGIDINLRANIVFSLTIYGIDTYLRANIVFSLTIYGIDTYLRANIVFGLTLHGIDTNLRTILAHFESNYSPHYSN